MKMLTANIYHLQWIFYIAGGPELYLDRFEEGTLD